MITKPSWGGIADGRRPYIGYAAICQGVSDCGRSSVAGCLREGLGKVANVVDIKNAPRGLVPACDAVLAMECVNLIPEPYFIYLCPEQAKPTPADPAVYERAAGLFAGNDRLARWLAEGMGIASEKIHVVHPALGPGQGLTRIGPPHLREAPRRKLLLSVSDCGGQPVSRESARLILDVLDILRQRHDPQTLLTISGLKNWPFPAPPPDGVTFRGVSPAVDRVALFDGHDLLVVPPWPGFGGLPEAFSLGVPCVIARTSELSDAVTPGITGAIVDDVNARELAAAIVSVLENDSIYRNCLERAPAMAAYFSWERVARQVTYVISREVS